MAENMKLPARLDLSAAQQLVQDLADKDLSSGIEFDANEVTHMGALCVQVLIAASRTVQDAGGQMTLDNVSERVDQQLASLGLTKEAVMEGAR
ncbi:MAG: STAS domain-containing protein [Paracoccaceae bacterium]